LIEKLKKILPANPVKTVLISSQIITIKFDLPSKTSLGTEAIKARGIRTVKTVEKAPVKTLLGI